MKEPMETSYSQGKLLLSIVGRDQGEPLVALTKQAGARGGTIILGRGTAASRFLELLSIGDTEKDLVLTLASAGEAEAIKRQLRGSESGRRRLAGIVMQLNLSGILRHLSAGVLPESEGAPIIARSPSMAATSEHVLIAAIVNRGYADDAMVAARKAGATGGTIINARGTGKEEDVKFFGIALVPEKELLLIVVAAEQSELVLGAIKAVPCLAEPGSGIAFCMAVEDFFRLGKNSD